MFFWKRERRPPGFLLENKKVSAPKKTLAIVMSYPLKKELAAGNRMLSFLHVAQAKGYQVRVYSLSNSTDTPRSTSFNHEIKPFLCILPGFFGRAIKEAISAIKLFNAVKKSKYDKVLVSIPSMFLLFVMPRKLAKSTYLDIRDLTWEYLSDKSYIQRAAKFVFRFLAKRKVDLFSAISVTNPCEYKYCCEVFDFPEPLTFLLPNGISRENFQKLSSISPSLVEANKQITITYIGNIGIPQNLFTFIEAASCCPNVIFNIVGSGENLSEVRKLKEKKNVSNVKFLGPLPWHELVNVYAETDILYAQLNHDFSGAIPSKLYEYLSTGKFFIYGGAGEALRLLDGFENHLTIEPENATKLVEAIKQSMDKVLWEHLSSANRLKIENNYIREHHVERWLEAIA